MNNVIYFPDSSVNILSSAALTESMKDCELTWVPTRKLMFWEVYKYNSSLRKLSSRIRYPNCISKSSGFCKIMGSIYRDATSNFSVASICTREDPRIYNPMNFTPEVEDEVIREVVSHKLDRPIVNPSNKVWRYSTQNKTPTSPFQIGDYLRYTN